jgi:hypothetical protein
MVCISCILWPLLAPALTLLSAWAFSVFAPFLKIFGGGAAASPPPTYSSASLSPSGSKCAASAANLSATMPCGTASSNPEPEKRADSAPCVGAAEVDAAASTSAAQQ